ncbi:MAG TPA: MFS transporter, partial [Gemmataceae bacterium]|nr:MFS transporter [Gemmataceae bacterium]
LPWSQIADRWLAADRCVFVCALVAGTLLWFAADMRDPRTLFWTRLVIMMFTVPLNSLGPVLAFRHLRHPDRDFGIVRMWGTVGWMAAGWTLTLWFMFIDAWTGTPHVGLSDSLRLGAIFGWILAAYSLTLRRTPPLHPESSREGILGVLHRMVDAPLAAMGLFRQRAFVVYVVCFFGAYVTWPFNLQLTSQLLHARGIPEDWLSTVLTITQVMEVVTLGMLPVLLRRFGQRRTMIVGITAWALGLIALTIGRPVGFLIASFLVHGFYITCFLVAGQIFVQRIAERHCRASAQGLLVLIAGVAQLLGNFCVGWIRTAAGPDDFVRAFLPAAVLVSGLAVYFAIRFRPHSPPPERLPERVA